MPRAASLSKASAVNRKASGKRPARGGGGVDLPNLPQFTGPPSGTFDPGLEAQVRAAERGLIDLIEKTRLEGHRASVDTRQARRLLERKVRQGQADLARQRGYTLEDAGLDRNRLQTNFQRDIEDLAIARQNGEEDYSRKLAEIQHAYATRAAVQQQAAVAQAVNDAGTTAASDAVRGANQAYDKGLTDTSHARAVAALNLADRRTREDYANRMGLVDQGLQRDLTRFGIQRHRMGQDLRTQRAALRRDLFRGLHDRHDTISKAKREYGIYVTDVAEQAFYQAHQLNPNIVFPVPAAAGGGAPHPADPTAPAIGGARPRRPGVVSGAPIKASRRAYRRPYLRY